MRLSPDTQAEAQGHQFPSLGKEPKLKFSCKKELKGKEDHLCSSRRQAHSLAIWLQGQEPKPQQDVYGRRSGNRPPPQ